LRELFELVRALAWLVAAKLTLNPHTQDRRMRHPNSLHGPVGHPSLYSVIFEIREAAEGEYYHLVTLWKATTTERKLYEEHST
jgi:hypothetical protein